MKNKELIKKLKPYIREARKAEDLFYSKIGKIERKMSKELGIKDLEIFMCDGSIAGIRRKKRKHHEVNTYRENRK